MICKQCNKKFEAKRKTQVYCARDCQLKSLARASKSGVAQEKDVAQEIISIAQEPAQEIIVAQDVAQEIKPGIINPDLTLHDFGGDVNKYQAYVINRNRQIRLRISDTPIDKLKQSGRFIPAWRYAQEQAGD